MRQNLARWFLQRLHADTIERQTILQRTGLRRSMLSDNRNVRITSVALVAIAHAVFLWAWIASAPALPKDTHTTELQVSVISIRTPEPSLPNNLLKPAVDFVPAPDISIEEQPTPNSVQQVNSASMIRVLAPRPDPAHPNPIPVFQTHSAHTGPNVTVLLEILVLPDGSVADAKVFKTSGQPAFDAFAIQFAKANWRYIPAQANGRPVKYWTTVLVPITLA